MKNNNLNHLIIILDRDGVINEDLPKGVQNLKSLHIYENDIKSLKKLTDEGVRICIASNQSNVGRGIINIDTLNKINKKIINTFNKLDIPIEYFICCEHSPDDNCDCRKPKPGMLNEIKDKYNNCEFIFIGDSITDYQAARNASMKFILVGTGKGKYSKKKLNNIKYYERLERFSYDFLIEHKLNNYHKEHIECINNIESNKIVIKDIAMRIMNHSNEGGLILTAGNGGSCAHAEHLVAELQVRFEEERRSIASVSLTSNTSSLTACSNDYSFEQTLKRNFSGFLYLKSPIILILFSTSGESNNIIQLAKYAKDNKILIFSFIGNQNSTLEKLSDLSVMSNSGRTCVTQDLHQFFIHSLCISIDALIK